MRAYVGGRVGPVSVRSENLLQGRRRRNLWTWLALFPLLLMWTVCKWMWLGLSRGTAAAWRAARR